MKIDWFDSEKHFFIDESVKRQITDSISENLTDSDLESKHSNIQWQNLFQSKIISWDILFMSQAMDILVCNKMDIQP